MTSDTGSVDSESPWCLAAALFPRAKIPSTVGLSHVRVTRRLSKSKRTYTNVTKKSVRKLRSPKNESDLSGRGQVTKLRSWNYCAAASHFSFRRGSVQVLCGSEWSEMRLILELKFHKSHRATGKRHETTEWNMEWKSHMSLICKKSMVASSWCVSLCEPVFSTGSFPSRMQDRIDTVDVSFVAS